MACIESSWRLPLRVPEGMHVSTGTETVATGMDAGNRGGTCDGFILPGSANTSGLISSLIGG